MFTRNTSAMVRTGEFYKYEKFSGGNLALSGSSTKTPDVRNGLYSNRTIDNIIRFSTVNPETKINALPVTSIRRAFERSGYL